jgi:hypothetical protein
LLTYFRVIATWAAQTIHDRICRKEEELIPGHVDHRFLPKIGLLQLVDSLKLSRRGVLLLHVAVVDDDCAEQALVFGLVLYLVGALSINGLGPITLKLIRHHSSFIIATKLAMGAVSKTGGTYSP